MNFLRTPLAAVAGSLAVILSAGSLASAQNPPLAEVARKEQERRKALETQKATTGPAKVLTNKDLPKVATPAPAPPAAVDTDKSEPPAAAQAGQPAAQPQDKAAEAPVKDEAWWRARITAVREQLARDQVLLDALQGRVNGLTSEFVGRDDPYQRAKLGEDRQKAILEMDRVRADVAASKQKIDDIEEEARKAGVPPGWLR
jgi:hypothetical protein